MTKLNQLGSIWVERNCEALIIKFHGNKKSHVYVGS